MIINKIVSITSFIMKLYGKKMCVDKILAVVNYWIVEFFCIMNTSSEYGHVHFAINRRRFRAYHKR
jgi:hypothetical protein